MSLADAYVEVKPDTSKFGPMLTRDLGRVNTGVPGEQAGSRFVSGFGRGLRTLGAVGVRAVTGLSVALGGAAVAAAGVGLKTAAANENAEIAFTTMLKSGRKAQGFIKELQAFAAATPFDFAGLQTAAGSLLSIGIESNKIIPIMTTLGDVTAGMGTGSQGIQRATVALQQMNAAGRITAEDLNQLRDAGIPVYDLLTAATGKTTAQISKMRDKGQLGREELEKLMHALETGEGLERFNGLMDKQAESLQGLWSTLKDTFSQGMATAIAPSLPLIKEGLGGAIKFAGDQLPGFAENIKGGVEWLGRLVDRVKDAKRSFDAGVFSKGVATLLDVPPDSGIVQFIYDLKVTFDDLIERVTSGDAQGMWDKIVDGVSKLGPLILELLQNLPALEPTISAASTIFGFMADHIDEISAALPYLIAGFVAYKAAQAANNAIGSNSLIGFTAQLVMMGAQTVAQFTLASAIRGSTAATIQNTGAQVSETLVARAGIIGRLRAVASMVAHRAASIASAAATKAAAAVQALWNAATSGTFLLTIRTTAAMVAQRGVMLAIRAATIAWTAIQWLLNAALTANPIGLVIAAIALLIGGIVLAYKNSDKFRAIVKEAFHDISAAATWMWEKVLRPAFVGISKAFLAVAEAIVDGAATAFGWVPGLGPKLKSAQKKFHEFKDSVNSALNKLDDKEITVSAKFRATYGLQAGGAKVTKETRGLKMGGPVPALPGSVPHQDSVSALLVPGEFVVREDGSNLQDAISHYQKKNAKRYKDGGLVVNAKRPGQRDVDTVVGMIKDAMSSDAAPKLAALAQARLDKEMAALAAQGGATYGPGGGGNTLARVRALLIPGAVITSTYRSPAHNAAVGGSPTSKHMDRNNPAVDIGGPTAVLDRLYPILKRVDHWRQLFWRVAGHYDHIHVADTGGMINPGQMGLNLGRKPERILSGDQTEAFERLVANLEKSGGLGGPRTLIVVDTDGHLIGRMRVEAGNVLDEELAAARWGES